jgi:hypothetical protein
MIANGYPVPAGFPFRGKGWSMGIVNHDPGGCYKLLQENAPSQIYRETRCPKEVIVRAENERAARRAHDLLWASFALVHGGQFWYELSDVDSMLIEDKELKKHPMNPARSTLQTSGVECACEIASKASFRKSIVFALAKYHFCSTICSVPIVDLDPMFTKEAFPKLNRPIESVQAATAIVLAYGVLEELGLEVRSSASKPSSLPDGSWNPVVRDRAIAPCWVIWHDWRCVFCRWQWRGWG